MSFHLRCFSGMLFLAACAAASGQNVRHELNGLRTQYENAVDREVSPLRDKYLATLKVLKEKYTKAGDLDSAILVDKELKAESASLVPSSAKLPDNENDMRQFVSGSVWGLMSDRNSKLEFRADGSIFDGKKVLAHYQVTGRRALVMYWGGGIGKGPIECAISEDCVAIAELSGHRAVYTRSK